MEGLEIMNATVTTESNLCLSALVDRVSEMAVLPHVIFKVLEISNQDEAPASAMESAITIDPGFTAKVLTLANSATYGLPRNVNSAKEAIMFLGLKTVRSIAMTVGIFDLFAGKNDVESLRRRSWWRHSVDSAVCAKWVAGTHKCPVPEEAYTCGLLHNIGKTLLDKFGTQDYADVSQLVALGVDELQAEDQVYGCHHTDVAVSIAKKWGFPESLQYGLDYRAEPEFGNPTAWLRACVALSSSLSVVARKGADPERFMLPDWALQALGKSDRDVNDLVVGATQAIGVQAT